MNPYQGVSLSSNAREWLDLSEREIERLRKSLGVSAVRSLEGRLALPADGRSDSAVVSREHQGGGGMRRRELFPCLRYHYHRGENCAPPQDENYLCVLESTDTGTTMRATYLVFRSAHPRALAAVGQP